MKFLLILFFITSVNIFSYNTTAYEDTVEVYLIEAFVTPEEPHTFILTFFTSELSKSKVVINKKYEYKISEEYSDNHKTQIVIEGLMFDSATVPFNIIVEDENGRKYISEKYEFRLPFEPEIVGGSYFFMCLVGGSVFLLPSPGVLIEKDKSYFMLTKEIPILAHYSGGYNYPAGFFSVEFSHHFDAPNKNIFRYGYKRVIEIPVFEYLAPGVSGFTNFKGFNGVSPELSIGFVRFLNTFTVYGKYRFNFKPGDKGNESHDLSIGLFSSFFTFHF